MHLVDALPAGDPILGGVGRVGLAHHGRDGKGAEDEREHGVGFLMRGRLCASLLYRASLVHFIKISDFLWVYRIQCTMRFRKKRAKNV